jgi:phthalate 4,5-cis-dihydrodiol dehydrogenase
MTQRLPLCGMTVVSCERGILRESSQGLYLHSDQGREEICCRDARGLAAGLLELRDAVREGRRGFPDGAWARTTLEVCLAILESSRRCREIEIGRSDGGTPR